MHLSVFVAVLLYVKSIKSLYVITFRFCVVVVVVSLSLDKAKKATQAIINKT